MSGPLLNLTKSSSLTCITCKHGVTQPSSATVGEHGIMLTFSSSRCKAKNVSKSGIMQAVPFCIKYIARPFPRIAFPCVK
jgi:hypothetical protein